jgi:hypothetical protein
MVIAGFQGTELQTSAADMEKKVKGGKSTEIL